jgi:hypothetical protein
MDEEMKLSKEEELKNYIPPGCHVFWVDVDENGNYKKLKEDKKNSKRDKRRHKMAGNAPECS